MFLNKLPGKIFIAAVLLIAGVIGFNAFTADAVQAAPASTVGVVNYQKLIYAHPDFPGVQQALETAKAQAKTEFDTKSVSMNDQEKQALYQKLVQDLGQKERELLTPIHEKIMDTIKSVADSKGLSIVITQEVVVTGGVEITSDVEKAITKK